MGNEGCHTMISIMYSEYLISPMLLGKNGVFTAAVRPPGFSVSHLVQTPGCPSSSGDHKMADTTENGGVLQSEALLSLSA